MTKAAMDMFTKCLALGEYTEITIATLSRLSYNEWAVK